MLVVKLTMWLISAMFSKKRKAKVVHFSSPELSVTVASFWKQRSDTLPVVKSQRPFRLKRRHVTNWSMTRLRMLDHLEKGIWCMSWNSSRLVWVNRYLLNSAILDQLAHLSHPLTWLLLVVYIYKINATKSSGGCGCWELPWRLAGAIIIGSCHRKCPLSAASR
jgi:hypothetical protein